MRGTGSGVCSCTKTHLRPTKVADICHASPKLAFRVPGTYIRSAQKGGRRNRDRKQKVPARCCSADANRCTILQPIQHRVRHTTPHRSNAESYIAYLCRRRRRLCPPPAPPAPADPPPPAFPPALNKRSNAVEAWGIGIQESQYSVRNTGPAKVPQTGATAVRCASNLMYSTRFKERRRSD